MKTICPRCKSQRTIKHSRRKIKFDKIQIYQCKNCKRYFSTKKFKYKNYNAKTVINAVSFYNSGYTLKQTAKQIRKKLNKKIPITTIQSWVKKYKNEHGKIM